MKTRSDMGIAIGNGGTIWIVQAVWMIRAQAYTRIAMKELRVCECTV